MDQLSQISHPDMMVRRDFKTRRPLSNRIQKPGRWTRGEKDKIPISENGSLF